MNNKQDYLLPAPLWIIIFWVTIIFLSFTVFAYHDANSDEGMVLGAAWQLWHSKVMYKDFFEFIAPGSAYTIYWVWKILGEATYISAKLTSILFFLVSAIGIWLITKRLSKRSISACLALAGWFYAVTFMPIINHNGFSSFIAVWVAYCLLLAQDKQKTWLYFITGALGAITAFFLQTKGGFLIAVSFIAPLITPHLTPKQRWQNLMAVGLGAFLTSFALWHEWSLPLLWQSLITYPSQFYWQCSLSVSWPSIIFIEIATITAWAFWGKVWRYSEYTLLWLIQLGLFLSSINLPNIAHFTINIFPAIIVASIKMGPMLSQDWRDLLPVRKIVFLIASIAVMVALIALRLSLLIYIPTHNIYVIDWRNKSIMDNMPPLVKNAKTIYAGPFLPDFYFELNKPNPFPYSMMLVCDKQCEQAMLQAFIKEKPDVVLLNYKMVKRLNYNYSSPLDTYIAKNYHFCDKISPLPVLIFTRTNCESTEIIK